MAKFLSTSAVALASVFFANSALATDLGNKGDPTSADYRAPSSFTGFYVGGQIGYGIASQTVTTLSTEHFAATPSRCYNLFENASEVDLPREEGDDDDGVLSIVKSISFVSTNNTEDGCKEALGVEEFGTRDLEHGGTQTTGFDAAVDAHSVTTRTVGEGSDSGFVGGFQAGYDHQLGSRLVLGVFGDFNWSDIADKNSDWTLGGRVGFLLDPRLMVYGLGGYTQADYGHGDYQGWTVGAGVEYALDRHIFVGASYRYTDLEEETLVDTPDLNVKSDIDEHKILVDLKVKLNGFGF